MSKYDKRSAKELKIPFAYQQKAILRFIKSKFNGKERCSALAIYNTLTWIASDFSKERPNYIPHNWPSMIHTYSGIGEETARRFLTKFKEFGIINYEHERNPINGRWDNWFVELPVTLPQEVLSLAVVEPVGGLTMTGESSTL
jgi:hypothetical protein